jgi:lipase ATG15
MFFRRRKDSGGCSSAGRVTAKLLLSFLAVSATPTHAAVNKQANQQAVLPYDPVPLAPLNPEPPSPAEHVFVSTAPSPPSTDQGCR